MENDWKKALHGGFAFMTAPFAVHPNDEERARKFLELAKVENVTLSQALGEARSYLEGQGCNEEAIQEQLRRVEKFSKPLQ